MDFTDLWYLTYIPTYANLNPLSSAAKFMDELHVCILTANTPTQNLTASNARKNWFNRFHLQIDFFAIMSIFKVIMLAKPRTVNSVSLINLDVFSKFKYVYDFNLGGFIEIIGNASFEK